MAGLEILARHRLRGVYAGLVLFGLIALSGCATSSRHTLEYIDPETAVTITRCARVLVFAHEAPQLGVNVRDYVNLGAFQVNRMGRRDVYLWAGAWSTIPQRSEQGPDFSSLLASLTLYVDGEPVTLARSASEVRQTGASRAVYPAPASGVVNAYYVVTLDVLQRMADAREISLALGRDSDAAVHYELWSDGRADLRDFLAATAQAGR